MGASRWMAVEAFTHEQSAREFKPGDFITGSEYERMGDPESFRPAEFPEQVAALRDAHGITDQPVAAGEFDPADHTVDEVNAYLHEADEDEKMRVLDLERASDNPRKGILEA